MLAFITTDADVSSPLLRIALTEAVNRSFNRISVDEDTSTSDSVMILASGLAQHPTITSLSPEFDLFQEALLDLCRDLAIQIVADGEGATKVFQVSIRGARHTRDADRIGRTVVGSPLVKT